MACFSTEKPRPNPVQCPSPGLLRCPALRWFWASLESRWSIVGASAWLSRFKNVDADTTGLLSGFRSKKSAAQSIQAASFDWRHSPPVQTGFFPETSWKNHPLFKFCGCSIPCLINFLIDDWWLTTYDLRLKISIWNGWIRLISIGKSTITNQHSLRKSYVVNHQSSIKKFIKQCTKYTV